MIKKQIFWCIAVASFCLVTIGCNTPDPPGGSSNGGSEISSNQGNQPSDDQSLPQAGGTPKR